MALSNMQIETMVNDVYSLAILCGIPSDELSKMFYDLPIFRTRKNGKYAYPRYLREYAKGYGMALRNRLYSDYLEFCYIGENGELYSTNKHTIHRKTEEWHERGEGHLLGKLPSGHFWKNTNKPFFIGGEK